MYSEPVDRLRGRNGSFEEDKMKVVSLFKVTDNVLKSNLFKCNIILSNTANHRDVISGCTVYEIISLAILPPLAVIVHQGFSSYHQAFNRLVKTNLFFLGHVLGPGFYQSQLDKILSYLVIICNSRVIRTTK